MDCTARFRRCRPYPASTPRGRRPRAPARTGRSAAPSGFSSAPQCRASRRRDGRRRCAPGPPRRSTRCQVAATGSARTHAPARWRPDPPVAAVPSAGRTRMGPPGRRRPRTSARQASTLTRRAPSRPCTSVPGSLRVGPTNTTGRQPRQRTCGQTNAYADAERGAHRLQRLPLDSVRGPRRARRQPRAWPSSRHGGSCTGRPPRRRSPAT